MFTVELEKDFLPELMKRLQNLHKKGNFSVGMYSESGKHYSGFTYVSLFKYLSEGNSARNLVGRPALQVAFMFKPPKKSPLKQSLRVYLSKIHKKKTLKDTHKVGHSVGKFYRKEVYDVFGDTSKIEENLPSTKAWKERMGADPNKPLIFNGSLRNKVSYKLEDLDSVYPYK